MMEFDWYAGDNAETYIIGPCDTREQALKEALSYGWDAIFLIEAAKRPVKIASYFSVDDLLERLLDDNDLTNEDGEIDLSIGTEEQQQELQTLVRKAIDAWQERHSIVITPWAFSLTRNAEVIAKAEGRS